MRSRDDGGIVNAREAQMLKALRESNDALGRCLTGNPLYEFELQDFSHLVWEHSKLVTKLEARYKEDARYKGNDK